MELETKFGKRVEVMIKKVFTEWAGYPEASHSMSNQDLKKVLEQKAPWRFNTIEEHYQKGSLWRRPTPLVLDVGFKIDFLFQNKKEEPFWGIDFVMHPETSNKGSWKQIEDKEGKICSLYQKGVYDAIEVDRMAVLVIRPPTEGLVFIDKDTRLPYILEEVDSLFMKMEETNNFLITGELDLRE